MDFARSFASSSQNGHPPNLSNFGINFQLPRFDLNSLVDSFNRGGFSPANFMPSSSTSADDTPVDRDMACENCGAKFNLLKRKVSRSMICLFTCTIPERSVAQGLKSLSNPPAPKLSCYYWFFHSCLTTYV